MSPEQQKRRTFDALVDQLTGLAAHRPVLAVYEDVHWADPSTLEWLESAIERVQTLPILVLITCRPEFSPRWTGHAHLTLLTLSRLGRRQGASMVEQLTGGKALPAEVLAQVLARTDGVPLFVEELTKAILESGMLAEESDRYILGGPLPPLAIPATLHDSLMARLDRFAPVKQVAQIASCIGREFSYDLVSMTAPLSEAILQDALKGLCASELVFCRGTPPNATYRFKHALVHEVAYRSLLRSRRQQLHARIATVLEEHFPESAETEPELLGHHYAEAGLKEQAVAYLQRAGVRALERSAYLEAISHLARGLELLEASSDTTERAQRELELQLALGSALMATKGYAAPEVEQAYVRARALCSHIDLTPRLFPVLHGLYRIYHVRGDLIAARGSGSISPSWGRVWAIRPSSWRPTGPLGYPCSGLERWLSPAPNWKKGQHYTMRSCCDRMPIPTALTLAWCVSPMQLSLGGFWALPTRPSTGARGRSLWLRNSHILTAAP